MKQLENSKVWQTLGSFAFNIEWWRTCRCLFVCGRRTAIEPGIRESYFIWQFLVSLENERIKGLLRLRQHLSKILYFVFRIMCCWS